MSLDDANQSLQFDKAVPANPQSASSQGVMCVVCQQAIGEKYYDVNGQSTCDRCGQELARHAETPTDLGVLMKAALYGVGAAIAGAVLYYGVIAITNFEIGIVAIAIGYMVGYAVRTAAGNRGGRRFQFLAVVLTYWAVGVAYTPFVFSGGDEEQTEMTAPAEAGTAATEPEAELVAAEETEPSESEADAVSAAGFILGIAALFALSFALPVLTVISSLPGGLISAAIIAFGMQQAWRMTGAPQFVISGPYRIARAAAS